MVVSVLVRIDAAALLTMPPTNDQTSSRVSRYTLLSWLLRSQTLYTERTWILNTSPHCLVAFCMSAMGFVAKALASCKNARDPSPLYPGNKIGECRLSKVKIAAAVAASKMTIVVKSAMAVVCNSLRRLRWLSYETSVSFSNSPWALSFFQNEGHVRRTALSTKL